MRNNSLNTKGLADLDPIDLPFTYNHETKMAVFLRERISQKDMEMLDKIAYKCKDANFPDDGWILYVGVDNGPDDYKQFSVGFYTLIAWCEANDYEWLRICP